MSGSTLRKAWASQDRGARQVKAGIAGDKAVVRFAHARGGDHRVPPAIRAAEHVGAGRGDAVEARDDGFGDRAERRVARIAIVRPRLRIEAEGRARPEPEGGEGGVGAGMAFVAAKHGEAAREPAFACNRIHVLRIAGRRNDLAVVAAVDLMQKAPVPRLRQPEFEAERVMVPVGAHALVGSAGNDAGLRLAIGRGRGHGRDDPHVRQADEFRGHIRASAGLGGRGGLFGGCGEGGSAGRGEQGNGAEGAA